MSTADLPIDGDAGAIELYRSLFAAYPDALLLVDTQGTIVQANPQADVLLGYAHGDLVGLSVEALVPEGIRPRHAAYRQAYAEWPRARPMGTQMELVARQHDGTEVMVEIALSPLTHDGLPYVVAAVRGIDSYPRVQQALRRARHSECLAQIARLAVDEPDPQVMLQRLPAAVADVLQTDSATVLLLEPGKRNFRLVAGIGLLPEETLGALVPNSEQSPAGYAARSSAALTVPDFAAEQRFAVPHGFFEHGLASGLAVPLSDRGQVMGVLMLRCRRVRQFGADEIQFVESMASLLATRLQRATSEDALQHSQRLETVGQLTGGIAHDFNNLLTIIQGNLQVLEERPAMQHDEPAAASLAAAMRASRRGAELTSKLLSFSRRQSLSPRELNVAAMLEAMVEMLRRTLDRSIQVEVDAERVHCLADPGQLESALLNLAVNARDAMLSGGVLRFACHPLPHLSDDLAAELAAGAAEGRHYAAIEVTDTGAGMSPEVSERAFEPFFSTKGPGRGTGLGLSTVYGFAKQSLGAVRLRSAPGEGTTVTLVLPRAQASAAAERSTVGDIEHGAGRPERLDGPLLPGLCVLLVEDQSEVRRTVSQTLRDLGCRVMEMDSAEQALAHLAEQATPDLLLSDVALGPGLRGTELARRARERWPGMGRLLMSGYAEDARTPGDDEVLRKPFDRERLVSALRRALVRAALSASAPKSGAG